jgi:predicted lipoprotein with Yx(FWY)xxD motif
MDRRTLLRNVAECSSVIILGPLAGCAQQGNDSSDGTTNTTTSNVSATVVVSSTDMFGDLLTDSKGITLYLFTKDTPGKSVCYDGCAKTWPPLTINGTSQLKAGPEVTAQIDTLERKDGSMQVTVADHPLYYYAGDTMPGDTNGQGLGGVWFVVGPKGQKKATQTTTPTTTTESGGGYGGY